MNGALKANGLSTAEREMTKSIIGGTLKNLTTQNDGLLRLFTRLPEQQIGIGDSWQDTRRVELFGNDVVTTDDFSVLTLANGKVYTHLKSGTQSELNGTRNSKLNSQMATTISGNQVGAVEYDQALGLVTNGGLKTYNVVRISMKTGAKNGERLDSTSYSKGTFTVATTL